MAAKKPQKPKKAHPTFKTWYDLNKDEYNRKRRLRYKKDAAYRESQLANTRAWRKKVSKTRKKVEPVIRPGYTVAEAAEYLGCYVKTIRNFEAQGLIPRVTPEGSQEHRYYTDNQVQLIGDIVEFRKVTHYKSPNYEKGLASLVKKAKALWRK